MIVMNGLSRSRQERPIENDDDAHGRADGCAGAEAALEVFDVCGVAVALCDMLGRVLRLNAAAERLLDGDFRVVQRRLACTSREATSALKRALRRLRTASGMRVVGRPIAVPRGGRRPILAYPMRLPSVCARPPAPCQSLVVLIDLDARPTLSPELLSLCFGLSAAEAKLAARLAAGEALESAAAALGIAKETARNQLKATFAKTGVHRQPELTALLARLLDPGRR